jgi:Ca2+-binding EF-hand superfamily protein/uncharacterized membrane protein
MLVSIIRGLRLCRVLRLVRLLGYFERLAKFVDAMMTSLMTMFSALIVLITVLYMFACLGAELIGNSETFKAHPEVGPIIEERFSTLARTMVTLTQFASADGLAALFIPLIYIQPALIIYFIACFLIITVLVMNLVAAIVLEDALYRSGQDREFEMLAKRRRIKQCRPWIEKAFEELDITRDGNLDVMELARGLDALASKLPDELARTLEAERLVDFFDFLDSDGSGDISLDEWIEGVNHLALMSRVPIETAQILCLLRAQKEQIRDLKEKTENILIRQRTSGPGAISWKVGGTNSAPAPRADNVDAV